MVHQIIQAECSENHYKSYNFAPIEFLKYMNSALKIGIIREGKMPGDTRVALIPDDCIQLMQRFPQIRIQVQSSGDRCYSDQEYREAGIEVRDDISSNDVLLGVKEVPVSHLIPGKTYFFFSHTIKKQPYNRHLMQALIQKRIRMIDYETLTDENGNRLIGFGFYAGVVGAHHALMMYGRRMNAYSVMPARDCKDYSAMIDQYQAVDFPPMKIIVTGSGKVAKGARKVLDDVGIREVATGTFLSGNHQEAVYIQLTNDLLYADQSGAFVKSEFYAQPESYHSKFREYARHADILINGVFWNERIPRLFESGEISDSDFSIKTIADVSCDVLGSVPVTTKVTTIADPVYAVDRHTLAEVEPYGDTYESIDMMTIDNLPNELPRDASAGFSRTMCDSIIPELLKPGSAVLDRAEICKTGSLSPNFEYLKDYAFELYPYTEK